MGLETGKEYDFKVRALNDVNLSSFSQSARFMAAKIPLAPLKPTSSFADQTSITIDWLPPYNGGTPLTSYLIKWNLGGNGDQFFDLVTLDDQVLTYTKTGLTTGELYKFKVIAGNFIGAGPESDVLSIYAATRPK